MPLLVALILTLAAPRSLAAQRTAPPADVVFRGGMVWTADSARPVARAVAVRGPRIAYVGDERGLGQRIGGRTRVIDLRGGMLLPGFHDSHVHPVTGGVARLGCEWSEDTTRAAVVEHIARCV